MADEQQTVVDITVLCQLLMMSRQRVNQLVADGWIKKQDRGQYGLVDSVQGYIRFLRDEHRRQNMSAAASRISDARAKDIEVRTALRLSHLVPREVYDEMIDGFAGVVRSEFAGVAATCTRDLPMRRIIDREVNARLRRVAEFAMAQALRLEAVRSTDSSIGGDGAGSVGGSKQNVSSNGGSAGTA
jgi:hypothetical protein